MLLLNQLISQKCMCVLKLDSLNLCTILHFSSETMLKRHFTTLHKCFISIMAVKKNPCFIGIKLISIYHIKSNKNESFKVAIFTNAASFYTRDSKSNLTVFGLCSNRGTFSSLFFWVCLDLASLLAPLSGSGARDFSFLCLSRLYFFDE